MLKLSSLLCWLSKSWVNDGNTSHREKRKELDVQQLNFLYTFSMRETQKMTSAEAEMFFLWSSPLIVILTPIHVTPTNTNYPLTAVSGAPQVAWDVSDLSRASLQTKPPPHNNSQRVKLSAQWCAQLLSPLQNMTSVSQDRSTGYTVLPPDSYLSSNICFQAFIY